MRKNLHMTENFGTSSCVTWIFAILFHEFFILLQGVVVLSFWLENTLTTLCYPDTLQYVSVTQKTCSLHWYESFPFFDTKVCHKCQMQSKDEIGTYSKLTYVTYMHGNYAKKKNHMYYYIRKISIKLRHDHMMGILMHLHISIPFWKCSYKALVLDMIWRSLHNAHQIVCIMNNSYNEAYF